MSQRFQLDREFREGTVLRSSAEAVLVTDDAGRIKFMNPEAERLTAWREEDALGHPAEELFRLRDGTEDHLDVDVVTGALRQHDVVRLVDGSVLVARDGVEHNICGRGAPVVDEHDNFSGAGIVFHDVTEATRDRNWHRFMHETSIELASSLDYQTTLARVARRAVEASLAEGSVVDLVEPDGSIRRVAGAHADPSKRPIMDVLVSLTHLDPGAPEGVPRAVRTREPVIYLDTGPENFEPGVHFIAGSEDPEYLRALRALDIHSWMGVPLVARERTLGAIMLGSSDPRRFGRSDVERTQEIAQCFALAIENARLYREACEAVAVRDDFVAVAAHELRTPLTALQLSLSSLAKVQRPEGDPGAAKVARAASQANRLARLSETLLDVATFSSGRVGLHPRELDLRELVANVVDLHGDEAARAHCEIDVDAGGPVVVRCDAARIEQAVASVLSNAIKFGQGHPIEVAVDSTDATGRILVKDHGVGIGGEDAARIFERFGRASSPRHYGGLGLGLYLAREIVEAHGGSISVSSRPGDGATFTLVVPAR